MKKHKHVFLQIVLGTFPVFLLWIAGYLINDPYGDFMFTKFEDMIIKIPGFVSVLIPFCICIIVIISGIIGGKCKFKIMFFTTFISTILPLISYGIICICSDDSNILSLLLLPLFLLLRPCGILCMATLDNITMSLNGNFSNYLNESFLIGLIIASSVISLLLYKISGRASDSPKPLKNYD